MADSKRQKVPDPGKEHERDAHVRTRSVHWIARVDGLLALQLVPTWIVGTFFLHSKISRKGVPELNYR